MAKFTDRVKDVMDAMKVSKIKGTFFLGDNAPIELILELKTISNQLDCLKYLHYNNQIDQKNMGKVILAFTSDSAKMSGLSYISNRSSRVEIIKSMKSDSIKLKSLSKIDAHDPDELECYCLEIIRTLKEDEYIYKALKFIETDFRKCEVVKLVKDEEIKKNIINKIMSGHYKTKAITYLKKDDDKILFLNSLNIDNQVKVIKSFSSDARKKKYSKNFDEPYRAEIESTFKAKDIVNIEEFDKTDNIDYKIAIINNVSEYNTRLRLIKKLNHSALKIMMLSNYSKYKKELLSAIENKNIYQANFIDPNMSLGIEIEFLTSDNVNYLLVKRMLQNWNIKRERSIEKGLEITSPVLSYSYDNLQEIYFITNFLRQNNFYINDECAGHIHVGADYLETPEEIRMLYHLYLNCERIFYLITNEEGTLPRYNIVNFANSISHRMNYKSSNLKNENEYNKLIDNIVDIQYASRNFGINILNANNSKNTLEFRIPNSTIKYEELMINVVLLMRLIQKAKSLCYLNKKDPLNISINNLAFEKDEFIRLNILLDLLFTNDKDKEVYKKRYKTNLKLLSQDLNHPLNKENFDQVNLLGGKRR